ncbi:MAG TPA: ribokinase [Chloroflexia bacterium]|nr:ribokinase [Chloroflexia bacterium]
MGARICVVGSANYDLTARVARMPRMGETLQGHAFEAGYGGKGANQAVMAAHLGAAVHLVARVGRDAFGVDTLQHYKALGIVTRDVRIDDAHPTGVALIFVDDAGHNLIVTVPGANAALSPADVQAARAAVEGADLVLGQREVPVDATLAAFQLAKAAGRRTILNPAPAGPLPPELLRLTDICVLNEAETDQLTGRPVATLADADAAAQELRARGPGVVIVTLGAQGVLCGQAGGGEHLPAPRVQPVDTTGAGDAFIGSLATFLAEGIALHPAIWRANAAAALSVQTVGAQASFPTRAAVDAFLAGLAATKS